MKFNVGGWAVVFDSQDLDGEYFHKGTEFGLGIGQDFSLHYEHGYDSYIGKQSIGKATLSLQPHGLAANAVVDVPNGFGKILKQLLADDMMGFSTGAAGHLVEKSQTNKGVSIDRWHLCELSLVAQPAEPSAYAELKRLLDEIKAEVREGMRQIRRDELVERARTNHYRLKHILMADRLGFDSSSVKKTFDLEAAALKRELEELR